MLIGIQPDLDREMTCLEWPCLQQDLSDTYIICIVGFYLRRHRPRHSAFKKKKHPFFWKGVSRIDIKQIEIKRVHLDSLSSLAFLAWRWLGCLMNPKPKQEHFVHSSIRQRPTGSRERTQAGWTEDKRRGRLDRKFR